MICHCSLDNSPGLYIYFGNITARSVRSCRSLLRSPLPPLFIVPHSERRSPIGPFRLGDSESDENEVLRPPVMRWWPDLRCLVPPEQRTHFQSFNDVQLPTPCPITLGTRLRYWPSSPIHAAHIEVLAEICAALFHFNRLIPFWAKKKKPWINGASEKTWWTSISAGSLQVSVIHRWPTRQSVTRTDIKLEGVVFQYLVFFPTWIQDLSETVKMSDINAIRLPFIPLIIIPPYVGGDVNSTLNRGERWAQHPSN